MAIRTNYHLVELIREKENNKEWENEVDKLIEGECFDLIEDNGKKATLKQEMWWKWTKNKANHQRDD